MTFESLIRRLAFQPTLRTTNPERGGPEDAWDLTRTQSERY
jgi:hypothetical protein